MATIIQLLVSGIAMGFIYGLIAIGITLIWNAAGMLNFAHGNVSMLSAYVFGVVLIDRILTVPSALVVIALAAIFGVLMAILIFIPLREMNRLCTIMATIMLGNILLETTRLLFGGLSIAVKPFITGVFDFGSIIIAKVYVYIIVVGILVAFALQLFLSKTKAGNAMQCVSQNKTAAALMGINVSKYLKYTAAMAFAVSAQDIFTSACCLGRNRMPSTPSTMMAASVKAYRRNTPVGSRTPRELPIRVIFNSTACMKPPKSNYCNNIPA